ncbi:MAG TPA: GGDEF domain-containing protein, partial [Gemmatimonadales bacterium]|nr:GGDEF domain-containing protein [Gemmatimonadales bacterium]
MPGRATMMGRALLEAQPAGRSRTNALVVSSGLLAAIALVDYFTGFEVQIAVLYLIPIFVASARVGRSAGMVFALLSSVAGVGSDLLAGQRFSSWPALVIEFVLRTALFLVFVEVIAALRHALDREKESARTDPLTGVSNRRHFIELTSAALAFARRYRRPMTIAYLDLDSFKQINDRFGHQTGDEVLRAVAHTVHNRLRATDVVGRLGGDEFAVCLPETGAEAAALVLGRLREDCTAALPESCRSVTVSVGMVTFAYPPATVDELLERTDTMLYAAKREGKNRMVHEVVPA